MLHSADTHVWCGSVLHRLLTGFSQIGFQNNRISGVLFMLAIGVSSVQMLLAAVISILVAQWVAVKLKAPVKTLDEGLYGYNAALSAIALMIFLPMSVWTIIVVMVCGAMTACLMKILLHWRISPYSCPFIISAWLVLGCVVLTEGWTGVSLQIPALETVDITPAEGFFYALGQVSFQPDPYSGMLVFFALIVGRWQSALWAGQAAITSLLFPAALLSVGVLPETQGQVFWHAPWLNVFLPMQMTPSDVPHLLQNSMNLGLLSFNAILATLVIADRSEATWWQTFMFALLCQCVTVVLALLGIIWGLILFTTPFVLVVYVAGWAIRWQFNQKVSI